MKISSDIIDPAVIKLPVKSHAIISVSVDAKTRQDIVFDLSSNLINEARKAGADAIAVACPLCHTNLDARQFQMGLEEEMPVMYFTQLMALALGLPEREAALNKNLVDPRPLLREKGLFN